MARISTYGQDSTLNKLDKVLGTDSATGGTKNYTIDSIMGLINEEGLVQAFDGSTFKFQSYIAGSSDPQGVINLNAGAASTVAFSAINQIYISTKDSTGLSLNEYLENADNDFIKISKKGNLNQFGIFEVTDITDHDGGAYKLLTLTPRGTNGNLVVNDDYFVSNYSALYDMDFSDNSVTEFGDVTDAGSGAIITSAERTSLNNFTANGLVHNDVVDNVTTTDTTVPLSANQGKILKGLIDSINTLLTSDNVDLDSLQEVVDYIEANKSTLDNLGIGNIAGLQSALAGKQDTEAGKGLSTEDFTSALLTKLNGIAAQAEVNVQSNWNEANSGLDSFILNKPSDLTNLSIHNVTELSDVTSAGSGDIITSAERTKLGGIESSADVTDTANVTAAGALMDSEVANLDDVKSFDPADYATAAQGATADGALPTTGGAMTGAITTNSTFDGRDVAADGFKLDTIENNANVTDFDNVRASGALMDSEVTNLDQVKQFDATDYATAAQGALADSAQQPPAEGPFVDGDKTKLDNTTSTATTIELAGTANEIEVSPTGAQDLSTNRTFTVGLPDDVTIGGDLIVNETIELANAQASTPTFDNGLYYSTEDAHDTLHFRYHGHDLSIDHLTENIPTGILNGGELSTNTSTTFDVAAGDGVINILNKDNSDPHPEIKKVEWAATTITHTLGDAGETDQLNTWVYVDSAGVIQQTLTIPSPSLWRNNIVLGSVIHSENVIRFVKTFPRTAYSNGNTVSEFIEIFGPLKKSGHLLTVNSINNMALDRSAGVAFALGRNYATDAEEPNLVSDGASTPVFHRYSSTSTGFTKDDGVAGAGYTDIDPTKYDNNGTLTAVSGGNYSVQRLYYFPNNTGVIVAYYGKAEYSSIDVAEKNYLLESFQEAENTYSQAIYLGAIVLKGNVTNLNTASDAKILTGGIFRSLSATNLGGVATGAILNDLGDVEIISPSNNQSIIYNSSTGNFENKNLEFDYDLVVDSKIVTKHNNNAKVMVTTVATKTAAHPAHNVGSSSGFVIDGVESPELTFAVGNTYYFDQSDSSNSNHPLRFYYDENKTTQYTAGVTTSGTPGQAGAYTQIVPSQSTPNVLYYQCSSHLNMGWKTVFNTRNLTGFSTNDLTEDTNLYYTDARFDTRLSSKDTGDLSEGSNLYYTDARVLSKINSTSVDALSDVDTTTSTPTSGQALVWDGSNFVPDTVGSTLTVQEEGSSLTGAATTLNFVGPSVTASGSGGTKTITIGGSIDDLSDVDTSTNAPSVGQILKWDGSNFVPGTDNSGSAASDSFSTISVSGQTNVVADSSADTLTLVAGDGMTITTDSATDSITFEASGGGGSGEIVKETFSGTGSQATFTLSNTIADIDNISVYVSGVYQYPSNYTVSGTDVTFVAGSIPASGTDNVHVVHTTTVASIAEVGSVFVDQFTGDGTATQFSPLGTSPTSENNTDVYIDGIYQQKNAYSILGDVITFGGAPGNGAYIEVKTSGTIAPAAVTASATNLVSDSFTATEGQTSFTLVNGSPSTKDLTMVFIQGVYQAKANYSLLANPNRIVLTAGVEVDDVVEVLSVTGANLNPSPVSSVNGQTGAVTVSSTMGVNVISSSTTATANNLYVFTANLTLTLPASPSAGDSIKISNRSGVATCVLARNGSNIMGSASDLTLDTASASFELIYSDATNGWVIIGQ